MPTKAPAAILSAIRSGDVDALRGAVKRNPAAVNRKFGRAGNETTPLHQAVKAGRVELVNVLLAAAALVDIEGDDAMTPLFAAARLGNTELARRLLDAGANPNHQSHSLHGHTALDFATRGGHLKMVRLLLDRSAAVDGERALERAITGDHWQTVALLLDRDADPNHGDAMLAAAERAPLRMLTRMIDAGGSVRTPHFYGGVLAKAAASLDKVQLLVARGADVNGSYKNGVRPLHAAAQHGNVDVARFLIASGAKVDDEKSDGQRPIHIAIRFLHADMIRYLLEAGAESSFLASTAIGQKQQVAQLLKQQPTLRDMPLPGGDGLLPVLVAVRFRQNTVLATLLEAGANPNAAHGGTSALHMAVDDLDPVRTITVEQLLEHGADPNCKLPADRFMFAGSAPLHALARQLAAADGLPADADASHVGLRVMALLLKYEADLDLKSKRGATPRQILAKSQHPLLVKASKTRD